MREYKNLLIGGAPAAVDEDEEEDEEDEDEEDPRIEKLKRYSSYFQRKKVLTVCMTDQPKYQAIPQSILRRKL